MPDGVGIAAATRADLAAIHRIESDSFPAPWRHEFFENELTADWRWCRVAKRDGVLIGYVFAMWLFDEMHINKIAVVSSERRQGIADALMADCFAFARQRGIKTISLEVRQSNAGAQEFYRHLDFESSYVRPRYYPDGEAAVVMTRAI
ncbi:MAG TPA: ribosomal protein S18-alanine N-acetyltransferase [Thermoanaerobaculia bacterium]|nr:ribosomal protein S18-alanine N-acetyltransferase [Thermoanaerobaculia bacterium]